METSSVTSKKVSSRPHKFAIRVEFSGDGTQKLLTDTLLFSPSLLLSLSLSTLLHSPKTDSELYLHSILLACLFADCLPLSVDQLFPTLLSFSLLLPFNHVYYQDHFASSSSS